jgi:hypothetical protein
MSNYESLSQADFSDLLDSISTMDERKRKLWMLIYKNAIEDRMRALEQYCDLKSIVIGKSTEHAVHGKTIASFIERMSKANDQLLKLADLVEAAEANAEATTEDSLYDSIVNT